MALSLRDSVRNRYAGIPSSFSVINDVLSKAKNDIGEPAYRTDDRSVSLRLLMIALNTTITRDTLGNITGANVTGGDGIARRFAITASNSRNGKSYLTTSARAEFFENEQRYLFITTTIIPGAGRVSQSTNAGNSEVGFTVDLTPATSSAPGKIALAAGRVGPAKTLVTGVLNLQGPVFAPLASTVNLSFPPEIQQALDRAVYFQGLFNTISSQNTASAAAAFQAVGVDMNMPLGTIWQKITIDWRQVGKAAAEAACWALGGAMAAFPAGGRLAGALGGAAASYCQNWVDSMFNTGDGQPPPMIQDPGPDAGVPFDNGMEMGNDPGGLSGQCVIPPQNEIIIHPNEPADTSVGDCIA